MKIDAVAGNKKDLRTKEQAIDIVFAEVDVHDEYTTEIIYFNSS